VATDAIVMVNGMGGTPQVELYIIYPAAGGDLRRTHGITIARSLVGNYITSLEMAGCSLTHPVRR
jgi:dihydroxyacetone kinase-like protein